MNQEWSFKTSPEAEKLPSDHSLTSFSRFNFSFFRSSSWERKFFDKTETKVQKQNFFLEVYILY